MARTHLGELPDGHPIALKFMNDSSIYFGREYRCYEKMDATTNEESIKYGIAFIYHTEAFLKYKMMAMTKLDIDLRSQHKKVGPFSKDTILILFRDLVSHEWTPQYDESLMIVFKFLWF